MRVKDRLTQATGVTLLESAILTVLVGLIVFGGLEYYRATVKLREARMTLSASRGELGVIADEIQRQIRRAARRPGAGLPARIAATHDTLEVYATKESSGAVDTLRYFVNHFDAPPSLIKQTNSATPSVFAQGVDSVLFVATGGADSIGLSVVLVATRADETSFAVRKRLGLVIAMGAR